MAAMLSWLFVVCCIMSSLHVASLKSINRHDIGKITSLVEELGNDLKTLAEDYKKDDSKFVDETDVAVREGLIDDIMWVDNGSGKRAIRANIQQWPKSGNKHPIPYTFSSNLLQNFQPIIEEAIADFNSKVCSSGPQFIPRTNEGHYVEFISDSGCYSYVGKINRAGQPISIGDGCQYKGTILHEMMHAIGFGHEHTRNDRDEYVTIKFENIISGRENNFEKIDDSHPRSEKTPYDYGSVMHYRRTAFSSNGKATIEVKDPSKEGVELGQRNGMSKLDIQDINDFYCPDESSTTPPATSTTSSTTSTTPPTTSTTSPTTSTTSPTTSTTSPTTSTTSPTTSTTSSTTSTTSSSSSTTSTTLASTLSTTSNPSVSIIASCNFGGARCNGIQYSRGWRNVKEGCRDSWWLCPWYSFTCGFSSHIRSICKKACGTCEASEGHLEIEEHGISHALIETSLLDLTGVDATSSEPDGKVRYCLHVTYRRLYDHSPILAVLNTTLNEEGRFQYYHSEVQSVPEEVIGDEWNDVSFDVDREIGTVGKIYLLAYPGQGLQIKEIDLIKGCHGAVPSRDQTMKNDQGRFKQEKLYQDGTKELFVK